MIRSRRGLIAWVPYIAVACGHVVLLAIDHAAAQPTKLLLMPLLALPVVAGAGRMRSIAAVAVLLLALLFSWFGDGAGSAVEGDTVLPLMLGCFGVAHLAYILLFARLVGERAVQRWAVGYGVWWVAMVAVVGPHAGALFPAVAIYGVVLAGTAAMATRCNAVVALGGAFFLLSDSLLAVRLFVPESAPGWFGPGVMATYALGQGLIVAGLLRRDSAASTPDFKSVIRFK